MLQSVERRRRGEAKRSGDKVREECGCEKREERGAAATRGKRVSNPASIKTGCGSALRAASQRRKEAQRRREASGDEEAAATRSEERGATRGAAPRESGAALPEKMAGRAGNDSQEVRRGARGRARS